MKEAEYIKVEVGDDRTGFAIGDFLNSINQVFQYFNNQRDCNSDKEYAAALRLFAASISEEEEGGG
jgi:hypothetical protein